MSAWQLVGYCETGTPSALTASFSVPTSNTLTYTIAGQSHTATLSTGVLSSVNDRNNAEASCSAILTVDPFYNTATHPASSMLSFVVSTLVAVVVAYRIHQ